MRDLTRSLRRLGCDAASKRDVLATFRQASLGPREGVTIVVGLPKGTIQPPPKPLLDKRKTVDDAFATLGSANLDVRSFNLNFELCVLLYGQEITERLLCFPREERNAEPQTAGSSSTGFPAKSVAAIMPW